MRINPLHAPDGIASGGRFAEHFDDGLVHNHYWAVTAEEAYPSSSQGLTSERGFWRPLSRAEASPLQSHAAVIPVQDRHDDGLVHYHHWAVTGQ